MIDDAHDNAIMMHMPWMNMLNTRGVTPEFGLGEGLQCPDAMKTRRPDESDSDEPNFSTVKQNWRKRGAGKGHFPKDDAWGSLARREGALDGRTTRNRGGSELRPAQGRG